MLVDMEFHHPDDPMRDHSQTRELPVPPRAGDRVLWTDLVGTGSGTERYREYVARGGWTGRCRRTAKAPPSGSGWTSSLTADLPRPVPEPSTSPRRQLGCVRVRNHQEWVRPVGFGGASAYADARVS